MELREGSCRSRATRRISVLSNVFEQFKHATWLIYAIYLQLFLLHSLFYLQNETYNT